MKLELEWDETKYELRSLHAPDQSGKFPHAWIAYARRVGHVWEGGQGHASTPQAALDDMIRQIEERVARKRENGYNEAKPAIVLDLNFDF